MNRELKKEVSRTGYIYRLEMLDGTVKMESHITSNQIRNISKENVKSIHCIDAVTGKLIEKWEGEIEMNLVGKTWGELSTKKQRELLIKGNCVNATTGVENQEGSCIVDIGNYSIAGEIKDGEIIISNDAVFYDPTGLN
jgi:hypothetical protein